MDHACTPAVSGFKRSRYGCASHSDEDAAGRGTHGRRASGWSAAAAAPSSAGGATGSAFGTPPTGKRRRVQPDGAGVEDAEQSEARAGSLLSLQEARPPESTASGAASDTRAARIRQRVHSVRGEDADDADDAGPVESRSASGAACGTGAARIRQRVHSVRGEDADDADDDADDDEPTLRNSDSQRGSPLPLPVRAAWLTPASGPRASGGGGTTTSGLRTSAGHTPASASALRLLSAPAPGRIKPPTQQMVQLTERPNERVLDFLLTAAAGLSPHDRRALQAYKKAMKHGRVHVVYQLGKALRGEASGRWYSQGPSCQGLPKQLRNALMRDACVDVDMVNAQPTLLVQLCAERGWPPCPLTQHYVANRDACLAAQIEAGLAVDRDGAKTLIIAAFFGKADVTLAPPLAGLASELQGVMAHNLAACLRDDADMVRAGVRVNKGRLSAELERLLAGSPDAVLATAAKNDGVVAGVRNLLGIVMAHVLQTAERDCLMAMERSLQRQGYTMATYIHDGGLVYKKQPGAAMPDAVLRQAENDVRDEVGYLVSLTCKAMDTELGLPEGAEDADAEYARLKAEFEHWHFLAGAEYVMQGNGDGGDLDRGITRMKRQELLDRYEHMRLQDGTSFIKRWVRDRTIRRYHRVEAVPPGSPPPSPGVFNAWSGVAAAALPPITVDERAEVARPAAAVTWHMRHIICAGSEPCYRYLLGWLACMLRTPGGKCQSAAIVLVGLQGIGKDLFIAFIAAIVGLRLVAKTAQPSLVFGPFNALLEGKLLTWLEEGGMGGYGPEAAAMLETAKSCITSATHAIRGLHKEARQAPAFERYLWSTNLPLPIPLDASCRRYFMLQVSDAKRGDGAYFAALVAAVENPRVQRWFYEWMTTDASLLQGWAGPAYPRTALQRDAVAAHVPAHVQFAVWLLQREQQREQPPAAAATHMHTSAAELYADFKVWAAEAGMTRAADRISGVKLLTLLKAIAPESGAVERHRQRGGNSWDIDVAMWRAALQRAGYDVPAALADEHVPPAAPLDAASVPQLQPPAALAVGSPAVPANAAAVGAGVALAARVGTAEVAEAAEVADAAEAAVAEAAEEAAAAEPTTSVSRGAPS